MVGFSGGLNITQFFLDTNILWWYLVENSKNHKVVKKYLDNLILDLDNLLFVNEFVVIELMHLLIKKSKKGYDISKELLSNRYPFLNIVQDFFAVNSLVELLEILNTYGHTTTIGGRDSSIILSMNKHQITNLISNDLAFGSVNNITLHNPMNELNLEK